MDTADTTDAFAASFLIEAAAAMPNFSAANKFHIAAWKGCYRGFLRDLNEREHERSTEGVTAILYSIDECVSLGDDDTTTRYKKLTVMRNLLFNLKLFEFEAPLTFTAACRLFRVAAVAL